MDRGLLLPPTGSMRRPPSIGLARLAQLTRLPVLVALWALVAAGGCVTPSIPIPPPDPSLMTFAVTTDSEGAVTSASLTYPATESYRGGVVYVYNRTLGRGIIEAVHPDGSIGPTPPVEAQLNHALVITVENDDQIVSTCVLLQEGTPTSYCP